MRKTYSLHEAKAGEPVVEMQPIENRGIGIKARMDDLADRGILVRMASSPGHPRTVTRKPGALKRFLADRD